MKFPLFNSKNYSTVGQLGPKKFKTVIRDNTNEDGPCDNVSNGASLQTTDHKSDDCLLKPPTNISGSDTEGTLTNSSLDHVSVLEPTLNDYLQQELPDMSIPFWEFFDKYKYYTILPSNNPELALLSLDSDNIYGSHICSNGDSVSTEIDNNEECLFDWWPSSSCSDTDMELNEFPSSSYTTSSSELQSLVDQINNNKKQLYETNGFFKMV